MLHPMLHSCYIAVTKVTLVTDVTLVTSNVTLQIVLDKTASGCYTYQNERKEVKKYLVL